MLTDTPTVPTAAAAPVVSVDLGGTNTRVAVVASDGRLLVHDVEPTACKDLHPDELTKQILRVVQGSGATHAVIGVPGRIDHDRGALEFAPNLPSHWADHLNEAHLGEVTGLTVSLANDADLAAVGEYRFGAGRGVRDMVYVTLSTGVGCGVILNGQLVHGLRSLAEAGHTTIDLHAKQGHRTLEETASGSALGRMAGAAGLQARGAELVAMVEQGDPGARAVWGQLTDAAGAGLANLAHLFSPELIVVGGGLGLSGDLLYEPLREALAAHGPRGLPEPIRIERARLGDDAGLTGAAGWASAYVQTAAHRE